eukprot:1069541-Pelagomonas_calceolata.AAC.2
MTGLPLNHQLTDLHASFVKACKTAPVYRMYSLGPRPALIRQHEKDAGGRNRTHVPFLMQLKGCAV